MNWICGKLIFLMVWQSRHQQPAPEPETSLTVEIKSESQDGLMLQSHALFRLYVQHELEGLTQKTVALMETFSAYKLIQWVQWDFSSYEEINHSDLRSTLLRGFRLSEKYLIYLSCISGPCSFDNKVLQFDVLIISWQPCYKYTLNNH